jgi:hypothetical protein
MTNLEQCKSVLADLERASGADRDLEIRIATTVDGWTLERRGKDKKTWLYQDRDKSWSGRKDPSPYGYGAYPRLTNSLDATIALVERELPGWEWLRKSPGTMTVYDPDIPEKTWAVHYDARGATPPLALLTAMFRALVAKMEGAE